MTKGDSEIPEVEGEIDDGKASLAPRLHDRLRSFVQRRERLDGEIADLQADKRELMREIKNAGFDMKGFGELLRRRKMGARAWDDLDDVAAMYGVAVGGLDSSLIDGGDLSAAPRLAPPQAKLTKDAKAMVEADAWAGGIGL